MTYNVYLTNLNQDKSFSMDSILLGEWCISNTSLLPSSIKTFPYHWRDTTKFSFDIEMLTQIYPLIFRHVVANLENILNVKYTDQFWHILLDPSLSVLLSTLWDRWESVTPILHLDSCHSIIFYKLPCSCMVSNSHSELIKNAAYSHRFNQFLFQEILLFRSRNRAPFNIVYFKDNSRQSPSTQQRQPLYSRYLTLIARFKSFLSNLFSHVGSRQIFFYKDSLPFSFKLRILLKTCPLSLRFLSKRKFNSPPSLNTSSKFPADTPIHSATPIDTKDFQEYLYSVVLDLLPSNFKSPSFFQHIWLRDFEYSPRFIFTAGAHLSDDNFKLWSAYKFLSGSKLFIAPHGGAIPTKYMDFGLHERYPDRLTWWFDNKHYFRRIYPGILIRKTLQTRQKGSTKKILFIGFEGTTFVFRPESVGQGCFTNDIYDHTISLFKALPNYVQESVIFRPYPSHGWNLVHRYSNYFKPSQISKDTFTHDLEISSLVICTYPQTAYLQSFASSIPTILFYLPQIWLTDPQYDRLLQDMESHNLISSHPQQTAHHIYNIYNNPLEWWNSSDIVRLRTSFIDTFVGQRSTLFSSYTSLFK